MIEQKIQRNDLEIDSKNKEQSDTAKIIENFEKREEKNKETYEELGGKAGIAEIYNKMSEFEKENLINKIKTFEKNIARKNRIFEHGDDTWNLIKHALTFDKSFFKEKEDEPAIIDSIYFFSASLLPVLLVGPYAVIKDIAQRISLGIEKLKLKNASRKLAQG